MQTLLERISPKYLELQRELHARPNGYGGKGNKWAPAVVALVAEYGATSVLDYGCGEGALGRVLRQQPNIFRVAEYDPAITGKDTAPLFADLVVCTDVLEHVEPDRLSAVLAHLHMLARKAVFVVVALDPSNKILLDGRNAHLILESSEWWSARLIEAGFRVREIQDGRDLPLPVAYDNPLKRAKRWIAIGEPC